jgi:hypothetical protein
MPSAMDLAASPVEMLAAETPIPATEGCRLWAHGAASGIGETARELHHLDRSAVNLMATRCVQRGDGNSP